MEAQILSKKLELGHCSIDLESRQVERDGVAQSLRPQEADLLAFFVDRAGEVLSREELHDAIWGGAVEGRSLDVAVSMLRSKIEMDPSSPVHLLTVHGVGYRFLPAVQVQPEWSTVSLPLEAADGFVGRASLMAELDRLLEPEGTAVLLKGPGGMGKTRLAKHFARSWPGDEVLFVDLAECESAMAVHHALAMQLGVLLSMEGGIDELVVLHNTLSDLAGCLLILDNVEQVADAVTELLEDWRASAPRIRWLLTSRNETSLSDCTVLELEPLSLDEGVNLLNARMNARIPGLEIGELERSSMREICQVLDGIPLAIELVAGQLAIYGAREIHRQLLLGVGSLSTSRSDLPERHRQLDRTIAWSWELLDPQARGCLLVCSVLRGGFSVERVSAIGVKEFEQSEVESGLARLSKASMIWETDTPGMYRLYEGIRQWCTEQPAFRDQEEEIRTRHASCMLRASDSFLQGLSTSHSVVARQEIAALGTELMAAGAWLESRAPALAAEVFLRAHELWGCRAPFPLHEDVLQRSIRCAEAAEESDLLVRARLAYASACSRHHHDEKAAIALELVRASVSEDSPRWGGFQLVSCQHLERMGDLEEAEQVAYAGMLWMENQSQPALACAFRITLANTWCRGGAFEDAAECLQKAMVDARACQDMELESRVEAALALIALEQDELELARQGMERALSLYRVLGNRVGETKMLGGLAQVAKSCGQRREAMEHLEQARVIAGRMGDVDSQAIVLCSKASLFSELDRGDMATLEWTQAVRLAVENDKPELESAVRMHKGFLLHQRGDLEPAAMELGKAILGLAVDSPHRVRVLAHLAALHAALGALDEAERVLEKGRECSGVLDLDSAILDVMEGLVDLARMRSTEDVRLQGEFFEKAHGRLEEAESGGGGEEVAVGSRILRRALRTEQRPGHARGGV